MKQPLAISLAGSPHSPPCCGSRPRLAGLQREGWVALLSADPRAQILHTRGVRKTSQESMVWKGLQARKKQESRKETSNIRQKYHHAGLAGPVLTSLKSGPGRNKEATKASRLPHQPSMDSQHICNFACISCRRSSR